MPTPTLYRLVPGDRRDELDARPVWAQPDGGPLAEGYRHVVPLGDRYLLGIDEAGTVSAFERHDEAPWFSPVDSEIDLRGEAGAGPYGPVWDVVRPLLVGDRLHLMTYAAERGQFAFFPIGRGLKAGVPYPFRRARPPGPTAGFDTVEPIVVGSMGGFPHVMCYDAETGRVVIYSLQVTATGFEGAAPLFARAVWDHQWAANWVRFAFFRMGSGTYFLKTNTGRLNVNIDHVLDDASQGATEVAGYLDLKDALDLDVVRPYVVAGEPGFVTYMDDGTTTFNRFHPDCEGWTTQAALSTIAGATHVVPLAGPGRDTLVLFC
jgi:hypothetical protein